MHTHTCPVLAQPTQYFRQGNHVSTSSGHIQQPALVSASSAYAHTDCSACVLHEIIWMWRIYCTFSVHQCSYRKSHQLRTHIPWPLLPSHLVHTSPTELLSPWLKIFYVILGQTSRASTGGSTLFCSFCQLLSYYTQAILETEQKHFVI